MKKAINILGMIFLWVVISACVLMLLLSTLALNIVDRTDKNLFGYGIFTVNDDISEHVGASKEDAVLFKKTDPSALAVGDIVAYISRQTDSIGQISISKIQSITADESNKLIFATDGKLTSSEDQLVAYDSILGKYAGRAPMMGEIVRAINTSRGFLGCVIAPIAILLLIIVFKIYRRSKKRKEKLLAEPENEAEQATCECDDQPAFPKEQDREKNMASEAEVPQTVTDTTVPASGLNFDGIDTREDLASVMADIDEKLPIKRGRHSAVKQESIEPEVEKGEMPIITEKVKKSENSTENVNAGEYVPTEEEILAYIEKLMSEEH